MWFLQYQVAHSCLPWYIIISTHRTTTASFVKYYPAIWWIVSLKLACLTLRPWLWRNFWFNQHTVWLRLSKVLYVTHTYCGTCHPFIHTKFSHFQCGNSKKEMFVCCGPLMGEPGVKLKWDYDTQSVSYIASKPSCIPPLEH